MARRRRRKEESLLDVLMEAPWQTSVVVGVAVFVGMKWMLPALGADNMFLRPISIALSELAWMFSGFFFLLGAVVYAKTAFSKSRQASGAFPGSTAADPVSAWKPPAWAPARTGQTEPLDAYDAWKKPSVGKTAKSTEWSVDLIREIEWKRFEDLCQKFYETKGIKSETTPLGPDGGIDIRLYQDGAATASAIVQCKAWGERMVGVKPVRELLGVMTHEKIGKAFFMTSGRFSDEAKDVAKSNRITLVDGEMLLMMIQRLPGGDQKKLLDFATAGDYSTPTCPGCGITMKRVPGKAGRPDFWGCHNYPRCRQIIGMRRAEV